MNPAVQAKFIRLDMRRRCEQCYTGRYEGNYVCFSYKWDGKDERSSDDRRRTRSDKQRDKPRDMQSTFSVGIILEGEEFPGKTHFFSLPTSNARLLRVMDELQTPWFFDKINAFASNRGTSERASDFEPVEQWTSANVRKTFGRARELYWFQNRLDAHPSQGPYELRGEKASKDSEFCEKERKAAQERGVPIRVFTL